MLDCALVIPNEIPLRILQAGTDVPQTSQMNKRETALNATCPLLFACLISTSVAGVCFKLMTPEPPKKYEVLAFWRLPVQHHIGISLQLLSMMSRGEDLNGYSRLFRSMNFVKPGGLYSEALDGVRSLGHFQHCPNIRRIDNIVNCRMHGSTAAYASGHNQTWLLGPVKSNASHGLQDKISTTSTSNILRYMRINQVNRMFNAGEENREGSESACGSSANRHRDQHALVLTRRQPLIFFVVCRGNYRRWQNIQRHGLTMRHSVEFSEGATGRHGRKQHALVVEMSPSLLLPLPETCTPESQPSPEGGDHWHLSQELLIELQDGHRGRVQAIPKENPKKKTPEERSTRQAACHASRKLALRTRESFVDWAGGGQMIAGKTIIRTSKVPADHSHGNGTNEEHRHPVATPYDVAQVRNRGSDLLIPDQIFEDWPEMCKDDH
ncbi:hypothetical protein ACRALDRAFT_212800 [Sodiomyces alcalophilus JCM 7366]|uniref:uncharacterized protein n=1 Tax=Sodiomyces alcalophilus JCM 7366 TaxID=591952 RepID=UPI0039B44D70